MTAANDGGTLECGSVITQDTTLAHDLGPCPGHGLIVAADGVTLDLGGHTIVGDPQARDGEDKAGVLLRGVSGVTVTNGTVRGFDAGVAILGGGGNTVRDITADGNVNYRVVTGRNADPDGADHEDGPTCLFGEGITVSDSSNNVIERNRITRNGPLSGISLVGDSNDNLVADNDVHDNDIANVGPNGQPTVCGTGPQGPMTRGRAVQNIGIRVEGPGADRNVIEGNRISRSAIAGISVHSHDTQRGIPANDAPVIRNNRITETGATTYEADPHAHGIAVLETGPAHIRPPDNITIEGNHSSGNLGHGIHIAGRGAGGHTVKDNVVNDNRGDGIVLEGPRGEVAGVTNTAVTGNRGEGNRVDGVDHTEGCGTNTWSANTFGTVNQPCVAADGTGSVVDPAAGAQA